MKSHTPRRIRYSALTSSLLMLLALAMWSIGVTVALAAVPVFPDNIIVFPDRDFISVEGYEGHAGETALLELTRPGVGLIGSATAVVSAGGVAFEVNHPGGVCWGNGTTLKVTPDIQPGDVATIKFGGVPAGDVRTQDAFVTADAVQNGTTVTVGGHISPLVNKLFTEQRIIEPALVDTAVGKRDVRAIPSDVLLPSANGSYSSMLQFPTADTFLATYVFADPATAAIVANAGLGERMMSWEVVDGAGNRQGITIAEFGEAGGPGVGGCPNGPLQSGPPGPTNVLAALQANGNIIVSWVPAVALPGTPAITGYRVHAVAQTVTNNQQIEIGRRITGQNATGTTISGLLLPAAETYDVYVVSVSSVGETLPAIHAIPVTDITLPVVTANPAGGTFTLPQAVTLTSNEPGQIFYTTDGSSPIDLGSTSLTAIEYTGPINISVDTTLQFVAFDLTGNVSDIGVANFVITNLPTPTAPTFGPATVGQGSIRLTWTDAPITPAITEYTVTVYSAATGGTVVRTLVLPAPASATTITALTAGTPYWVSIKAANANGYGPESARLGPLTPQGATVASAGPDQSVVRGTVVTLNGTASLGATTFSWVQTAPAAPVVVLSGANTAQPTFTFPATLAGPLTFQLTITGPGGSASDTVIISALDVDPLTLTRNVFRRGTNEWRLDGTATILGAPAGPGNTITITLIKTTTVGGVTTVTETSLGTAPVDNLGVWIRRFTTTVAAQQPTAANSTYRLRITSSRGGLLDNQQITIRQ